jgi:predicted SnoaL-like aldol condensation-catalyzing enzyme
LEVRAIDMFRISDGKIVEHWGHADDPTGFLRAPKCS